MEESPRGREGHGVFQRRSWGDVQRRLTKYPTTSRWRAVVPPALAARPRWNHNKNKKTGWPPQETGRSAGTLCFTIRRRQPSKGTNTCSTMLAWRTGKVSCPMGPMERLVPRPAAVWSRASWCCASWPTFSHRPSWRRASWPTSSRPFSSQRASSCCHPRLSSQLFFS